LLAAAVEHARLADVALQKAHLELAEHARALERTVEARTQKLRESVQDLEAFSYSVAHDLRAPLRTIHGYSTLVQEEHGDKLEESGKDYLRRVISAASRLDRLIEDTLNYSKVVRDELKLEPMDIAATIRGVIDTYPNLQMHSKRITLSGSFPWVLANPAAFSQIVSNLLGNAVKFVKPGVAPHVRMWAESVPGDAVRIWFEDDGIGIEKAVQSKVFEMFQRAASSSQYEGNGIGLSIVRKSAERMGGNVGVESEPGRGSRFWVVLKAATQPVAG
jgi:signal transduction histidine kinase